MQEFSLHAALKDWYTAEGDQQEVWVDGYLVDVVHEDLLIEVQTRNFYKLKGKLDELLERHRICLVHPIAQEKWIVKLPEKGDTPIDRRKSPRRGRLEHLFLEAVRIPHLIAHPNFSLEILLIREEEIRRDDGKGSWRRGGWSIVDRRLLEVIRCVRLDGPEDFRSFLPESLPDSFTVKDLASAARVPRYLAQKTVYCLKKLKLIETASRKGRAYLYTQTPRAAIPRGPSTL